MWITMWTTLAHLEWLCVHVHSVHTPHPPRSVSLSHGDLASRCGRERYVQSYGSLRNNQYQNLPTRANTGS